MRKYIIRNDVTGHCWTASASEARMYALGGIIEEGCYGYTVFQAQGGTQGLIACEVVDQ